MVQIPSIFVIGDSHVDVFNNSVLFNVVHIGPATAFNLIRERNSTGSYEKLMGFIQTVRKGDIILLVFGEIDCRIHIYYQFKKNQEQTSIPKLIELTIQNYGKIIKIIRDSGLEVCVCGVIPVGEEGNIYNYPYFAERHIQSSIYREFNSQLKLYCDYSGIAFLNIYPLTSDVSGFLLREFSDDGVHLNKKILPEIENQLFSIFGTKLKLRKSINLIRTTWHTLFALIKDFPLLKLVESKK